MTKIAEVPVGINISRKPKSKVAQMIAKATKESLADPKRLPVWLPNVPVTPEMAEDIEHMNVANRKYSIELAQEHSYNIEKGTFLQNGDTFCFDTNYAMIDGQHRNGGIRLSGKTVYVTFCCGLDPDAIYTKDAGKRRSGTDTLTIKKFEHPEVLSTAIRLVKLMEKGIVTSSTKKAQISNQALAAFMKNQTQGKKISKCVAAAVNELFKEAKFLSKPQWAALYFTLGELDADEAKYFIEKLATGDKLDSESRRTSAIYWLKRRLEKGVANDADVKTGNDKIMKKFKFIYKAWNAFKAKRLMSREDMELTPNEKNSAYLPVLAK